MNDGTMVVDPRDIPEELQAIVMMALTNPGGRLTLIKARRLDNHEVVYMLAFLYEDKDHGVPFDQLCSFDEMQGTDGNINIMPIAELRTDWMDRVNPMLAKEDDELSDQERLILPSFDA